MKISVTQENLAKALSHVIKATAQKPNIPVLANILISTERGKVKFSATNLDISISSWIGADVAEEGEVTVNARLLTEFVGQLKATRVELLQTGQTLEVKSVDNQAQLFIIPAEDFPTLPNVERDADMVVNALDLSDAIGKTAFAAAIDQSRPVLTGLLLESTERKASLVGVDGFRLSKKTMKLEKGLPEDMSAIIPAKSLQELAKIVEDIADNKDNVNIFFLKDKNQVLFKVNEVVFSTRLLEGEYPDYKQIIPTESQYSFTMSGKDFADTVRIATIFARNILGNKTFFKVHSEEKKLSLAAKVSDMGNNESQIDIKEFEGDGDYETAYNAKFLADMVASIHSEDIRFESGGMTAPGVFKDLDDENYIHIIMPMRIE
jgi:DNA polymerase-3 subunit beta